MLPPRWIDKEKQQINPEYKRVTNLLYETQRACARVANVCLRDLWRRDGEIIDASNGRAPKPWKMPPHDGTAAATHLYRLSGRIAPELPGSMRSVLSKRIADQWAKTRWDALVRLTRTPAHFRDTIPIPLRAADTHVTCENGAYVISFALSAGVGQRLRIMLLAKDTYQRNLLAQIASGEWRMGEVAILRDRKNKWHARIAYKRTVNVVTGKKAAAINRGIRCFLAGVTDDERWLYDGHDIVAYLRQIQSRRREYQRSVIASGRTGHGRRRTLKPIARLEEKGQNWRATKCQVIARRFAEWCRARAVDVVYAEDFAGIRDGEPITDEIHQLVQEWPYFQLLSRLRSCLEEYGIALTVVSAEYISQTCPACGHVAEKNRDLRSWRLLCVACGWRDHLDVAAARNVLARGRASASAARRTP